MTDIITTIENDIVSETAKFLPAPVQSFVVLLLTDEGKILQSVTSSVLPALETEVAAHGLTTATAVATAKDIFAQLATQNITTFTLQHVFGYLNLVLASSTAQAPATTTPAA